MRNMRKRFNLYSSESFSLSLSLDFFSPPSLIQEEYLNSRSRVISRIHDIWMLRAQQQQLRSTPLGEGSHPTFGQIESPPGLSLRTHPTSGSPTTPVVTTANDWLSASLTYIRLSQVLPRFLSRAVSPVVRTSFSFPARRFIRRHAPAARPRLSPERVLPVLIVFVSPSRAEKLCSPETDREIAGRDLQIRGDAPAVIARRDNGVWKNHPGGGDDLGICTGIPLPEGICRFRLFRIPVWVL